MEILSSVVFDLSEEKICGKTNRIGELQIYALLRGHSSVDFENTRWKCATYAVKWKPDRWLQRRNLQTYVRRKRKNLSNGKRSICTASRFEGVLFQWD